MSQGRRGVHDISKCMIRPRHISEESQKLCYLTPWDLPLLSVDYTESSILFNKPEHIAVETILEKLKDSLSITLTHFFPLSGQLVTIKNLDLVPSHSYCVLLDCKDGRGALFVHAVADAKITDILSCIDVPPLVESLFALDRSINHDGHTQPLLAVKITELLDGISISCSFNHVVGDGSSFWHFMNAWSEISRSIFQNKNIHSISCPPVTKRWFLNDHDHVINLPFSHPDEFIERFIPQAYRERVFHFTSQSIANLKAKANADLSTTNKISSFQAVASQVWRSVTRARNLLATETTKCVFPIDCRSRLDPKLPKDYFGNCILGVWVITTTQELLGNNLGWCAGLLHKEIMEFNNNKIRSILEAITKAPSIQQFGSTVDNTGLVFGKSPRFDVYTNDFGWGAPVAVRSGNSLKFDGKAELLPGREGKGSMDLDICLSPESMNALESDMEFIDAVSPTPSI